MGWTALEYAIERDQATIALMLLRADAPLENRDRVSRASRLPPSGHCSIELKSNRIELKE